MIESTNPDIDVESLMRRIQAELAHAREIGLNLPPLADDCDLVLSVPHASSSPPLAPTIVPDRAGHYRLGELLSFHGEAFIRVAYLSILRREPDATGFSDYLDMLRKGASKVDILAQLRFSPEGRAASVEVEGLRVRAVLHRMYRLPFLGRLLRIATALWNLPEMLRNQRTFENHVMTLFDATQAAARLEGKVLRDNLNLLDENLRTRYRRHQTYVGILRRAIGDLMHSKADAEPLTALLHDIEVLSKGLQRDQDTLRVELHRFAAQIGEAIDQARREASLAVGRTDEALREVSRDLRLLLEEDHLLDTMYAALEDRFRGARADIKQRQSIYLPYIDKAKAGGAHAPVIDLGCGRGEWLELLQETRLVARGVDLNRIFLRECTDRNLVVVEQDAIEYLRSLRDGSVGAITAFHVIEHLPVRTAIALLDEALRVLRTGGVFIIETPNPDNLLVGACNFYIDPTHRHPLPRELSQFWVEACGFVNVETLTLHPVDNDWLQGASDHVALTVNHYLYGPRDYAVIGWKA